MWVWARQVKREMKKNRREIRKKQRDCGETEQEWLAGRKEMSVTCVPVLWQMPAHTFPLKISFKNSCPSPA